MERPTEGIRPEPSRASSHHMPRLWKGLLAVVVGAILGFVILVVWARSRMTLTPAPSPAPAERAPAAALEDF